MAATSEKKFRMAALDLDGTLLNSSHDISDATVDYLRRLHARGFVVAIATGRSAACAAHVIEKLDLRHPPSSGDEDGGGPPSGFPLVCFNGARGMSVRGSDAGVGTDRASVRGPRAAAREGVGPSSAPPHRGDAAPANPFLREALFIDRELFHYPLPIPVALQTLGLARRLGCATNYYHGHYIYAAVRSEEQLELTRRYARLTGSAELYRYLDEQGGDGVVVDAHGYGRAIWLGPPSKLLILCDAERVDEVAGILGRELNGDGVRRAHVVRGSPPFFVEVLNPAVNKGRGLHRLCRALSIPPEEVVAFGDGDNDLEFVRTAGRGVAMANARDVLKAAADEVSEWNNDEDGVIRMLQKYERQGKLHLPIESDEEGGS